MTFVEKIEVMFHRAPCSAAALIFLQQKKKCLNVFKKNFKMHILKKKKIHPASLWKVNSCKMKEVQYRNLVPEFCCHCQLNVFYRNRLMKPKNLI